MLFSKGEQGAHLVTNNSKSSVFDSVEELAAELNLSRAKTYEALRKGQIPSIRVGKRFIIPRAAVRRWLDECGDRIPAATLTEAA